jgi:glutaredoxin
LLKELKCKDICPFNDENRVITVFKASGCKPCSVLVPSIVERAERASFTVEVIDVNDEAAQERVRESQVRWVPHLEYLGREITVNDFETLIDREHSSESQKMRHNDLAG